MFIRSRPSEGDGQGRDKENFSVVEQSSLSKYCGPGRGQQSPFPCPSRCSRQSSLPALPKPPLGKYDGEGAHTGPKLLSQRSSQW